MSLMNDMLRDLASRQPNADIALNDTAQLLADSSLARRQRQVLFPSLVVFFVVIIMIVAAQHYFRAEAEYLPMGSGEQESAADWVVELQQPMLNAQPSSIQTSLDNAIESDQHAATLDQSTIKENYSDDQEKIINAWLQLASRSMAHDQLTAPVEDSAYYYYQQVLTLVPQHPQAKNGLNNIVERYIELIEVAAQQQDYRRAHTLLVRAKMVVADHPALGELEAQLAATQYVGNSEVSSSDEHEAQPALTPAASLVATQSVGATETSIKTEGATAEKPNIEAVESYSLPAQTSLVNQMQVTPNRAWQDQQAAAQANALIQRGQVQSARLQLEAFLQQHSGASLSGQLLCSIYLQQGDLAAAEKILASTETETWPEHDAVRLRAQWLIAKGDAQTALTLLETNLGQAENNERYRALLASLYQSNGNYQQAVASYRRMLSTFGEKSAYWLGLALALDGLEQNASALESYRRAQSFQNLQGEVVTYIEQRVAALSR